MRVLVTGGTGFLGRAVIARLPATATCWPPKHANFNLCNAGSVDAVVGTYRPTHLIHLAAPYGGGGIGYAAAHPFELASQMVLMDTLLIQAAVKYGVEQVIGVGSVCAYPENPWWAETDPDGENYTSGPPVSEDRLLLGAPEPINGFYGHAKRQQLSLLQAARKEHNLNGTHLILANLYGPGDKFETGTVRGHVIPATIMKCVDAVESQAESITCWGDGTPTRSFTYIGDAADAVVAALGKDIGGEPVNICSEDEMSVRFLVEVIAVMTGFKGRVTWDTTKPNGQMRRLFSNARAKERLGWSPTVDLRTGLERTVNWYLAERAEARGASA